MAKGGGVTDRVIYLKGGRAIEEARRLYPRLGELPDGGPDKFLLAVLFHARHAAFRLTSLGPDTLREHVDGREVVEYGARPVVGGRFARALAFVLAGLGFVWDSVRFRPTRLLCGVDGVFAIFTWLAARMSGAQLVFLAHSALTLPGTSAPHRWVNGFLCRHADLVIAHGPYVRDEVLSLGTRADRALEFNNALDAAHEQLLHGLSTRRDDGKGDVVLYVGRVEEDKGVLDLYRAFTAMPLGSGVRLRFVGQGSANDVLRQWVARDRLDERVQVLGPVPFEDVFAHLSEAAVLVTPSQSRFPEGFCKSAMEAFYVGTPVIAPDYGPFPYMVKHEDNGLLYAVDNVDDLRKALLRFLGEPALRERLQQGARHWGRKFMHPETTFAKAIERVFAQSIHLSSLQRDP